MTAHVIDGTGEKLGEKLFFCLCEALYQPLFVITDGLMHHFGAFVALGKNVDAFAPPVVGIGPKLDKALLLHSG